MQEQKYIEVEVGNDIYEFPESMSQQEMAYHIKSHLRQRGIEIPSDKSNNQNSQQKLQDLTDATIAGIKEDWSDAAKEKRRNKSRVSASDRLANFSRGAAQGFTFGLADEIMAGTAALPAKMLRPELFEGQSISDIYKDARDIQRQKDKKAMEKTPAAYIAGNVAGGIFSPFNKALGITKIAHAPTKMGKVAQAAKFSGKAGALSGYGHSEADSLTGDAVNTVMGAGAGAVLGGGLQGAGSLARDGVNKSLRGIFGVNKDKVAQFDAAGLRGINIADVSDHRSMKTLQNNIAEAPLIGGGINKAKDQVTNSLREKVTEIAPFKNANMQDAGEAIKKGAKDYVKRFKRASEDLYSRLARHVPLETKVGGQNTSAFKQELENSYASALNADKIVYKKYLKVFNDAAREGELNLGFLKEMRSQVGENLSDTNLIGTSDHNLLKGLYSAISNDIGDAMKQKSHQAFQEWRNADSFYREGAEKIQNKLTSIIKRLDDEKVLQNVLNQSKLGGTKIQKIFKSLKEGDRQVARSAVINQLGKHLPHGEDAFSVAKFVTNFSKISPEAREAIFTSQQNAALKRLVKVAEMVKKSGQEGGNPSGTGKQITALATGAGLATGNIGGILLGLGGGAIGSKLMTSSRFIHWLADASKSKNTAGAFRDRISELRNIAVREPEIREEVEEIMKHYYDAFNGNL